jgi:hypothetical protein
LSERPDRLAQQRSGKRVIHLAIRWMLDQGITTALWGTRHPWPPASGRRGERVAGRCPHQGGELILGEAITKPIGPEFMAPDRSIAA